MAERHDIRHGEVRESVPPLPFVEHAAALIEALGLRRVGREWHGPCPACGGTDRFWIADYGGRLSVNCRQCRGPEPFRALVANGLLPRPGRGPDAHPPYRSQPPLPPRTGKEPGNRREFALTLWNRGEPLPKSLGERYLRELRGVDPSGIEDLRFLPKARLDGKQVPALLALMRDPKTAEPLGVHRTFLDADGRKLDRRMLGPAGVVMIDPDDAVTTGLAICEGLEDGLALRKVHRPVWCCLSAGGIRRFPVLGGIETLTIYADADAAGGEAADACGQRWSDAGREVVVRTPVDADDPAEALS